MSIAELVLGLTNKIQDEFYDGRVNDFWRDYRALAKAITRYGLECQQRGWEVSTEDIYRDLSRLLNKIRPHRQDIHYLPVYLESAIGKHVATRAEEIQAASGSTGRSVSVVMDGVQSVARVVSSDTELIAKLHASLIKKKSTEKAHKQLSLI